MSYPDQAPARRPVVVVLAAVVLALMAAGALAYAVLGLLTVGGAVAEFRSAAQATSATSDEVDGVALLLWAYTVLSVVLSVLVGLLLVGLAVGLAAGRPAARVATWVVSGLGLFCGCFGLVALVGQRGSPLHVDERSTAELFALVADAFPSWWIPLNAGLSVGQMLGYVVVAGLLVLPAANAWFRRGRPAPPPPYRQPAPPFQPYPPPGAPTSPPYPPR